MLKDTPSAPPEKKKKGNGCIMYLNYHLPSNILITKCLHIPLRYSQKRAQKGKINALIKPWYCGVYNVLLGQAQVISIVTWFCLIPPGCRGDWT